eukprot:3408426-Amphidinium_carterae.1
MARGISHDAGLDPPDMSVYWACFKMVLRPLLRTHTFTGSTTTHIHTYQTSANEKLDTLAQVVVFLHERKADTLVKAVDQAKSTRVTELRSGMHLQILEFKCVGLQSARMLLKLDVQEIHGAEHCSVASCMQLDFLPFKCDACKKVVLSL